MTPKTVDEKKIDNIFDNKNDEHQLCNSDDQWTRKEFHKIFKVCKFIADHIEKNNTPEDNLAYDHAYKMVVAFADSPNKKYVDTLKNYRDFLQ
ncbi:hypothetical protein [Candidatus Tisiphia endosymbiont of Nemotelus uliginosus]|uniref:hypothetical protein n=1 Tax=Candidatus Tisiphia endosymbiont of Nemotelus uliginosus TaxID=3077926 RepID=UPI0035C8D2DB